MSPRREGGSLPLKTVHPLDLDNDDHVLDAVCHSLHLVGLSPALGISPILGGTDVSGSSGRAGVMWVSQHLVSLVCSQDGDELVRFW